MRYDDASQIGSTGHSEPVARPDEDRLPAGSFGPATGNAITGAGTTSGASGADNVGTGPGAITAVQGAGGQTVTANGAYQASGQYGLLSMDMQGNFSYVRNPGTPDGVKDVFNYTLADASGANSSTTLTIDIGQVAAAAAGQGIVNLPQGVELSDIHVNGRDLIVNMPDGTQMVIPGGAVFVPQLVIGDVQVPPTNLAALLIDNEPQPAAGPPQSSGGNFADPVPPLDPGVPLGDLIPPTELHYTPPEFNEIGQFENQKPTVVIEPHDLAPGAVDAVDQVDEKGLPARDGNLPNEPAGSGEIADGNGTNDSDPSEHTFGQIVFTSGDGLQSITVDGVAINGASVGTTIHGQFGVMTITSVNLAAGTIGYNYVLSDNTSGDNTADHFTVVVTDTTGDTATATLTVDIIDDVPTARNDTDAITGNDQSTDGNVMTGAGTTSGAAGADTVGADNATVTGAHGSASGTFTTVPQDGSGVVIHGAFGDLTLHDDGTYTYARADVHQGGTDVFTYQLTDGDGDTSTATLTISVPQVNQPPVVEGSATNVSEEGLVGGNPDSSGSPDTTNSATASGNIGASDPDGDALTISLQAPSGNFTSGGQPVTWAVSDSGHTLTGSAGGNAVITITIDNSGHYNVSLTGPFDDPNPNAEDSISVTVPVAVSDGVDTTPSTLVVTVEDDSPVVNPTVNADATVTLDETGPAVASAINTGAIVKGDDPDVAGNGAISSATSGSAIVDAHAAFGGDGPAASDSLTYALSITSVSSGLTTTDGSAINLVMENGNIVGVVSGGAFDGEAAFAISINSATGIVTVEQYLSLDHPNASDPNDALHMVTGSVGVTVTATDADADHTTSGAVDVSNQITFLDDGPTVSPTLHADATVTLDETATSSTVATIDTGAVVKGDDPDVSGTGAISTANSGSAVIDAHAAFGADGPAVTGSLAYALSITSASSGLETTDGHAINLVMENGNIVGVVAGGAFDGEAAFAITINSSTGVVTVEQYLSLDHPDASDPNDALHMLTGSVGVTVTATDGDGDHVTSGAVDVSNQITFLDDGPTVSPTVHADATVILDESGPTAAATISLGAIVQGDDPDVSGSGAISKATSGVAIVDAHAAFGADGPATSNSLSYALDITNASSGLTTTDGHAINLVMENGNIVGVVSGGAFDGEAAFAISINSSTGVVTVEQYLSLDHPITTDPNDALHMLTGSVGVTVTATDGDGDHVTSGAVDVSNQITFLDDGPTAHADTNTVSEGGTVTGNVETNDLFGADGKTAGGGVTGVEAGSHTGDVVTTGIGAPIAGTFGTLTLNADGSYSYHANANTNPPPGSTDVFTYTIKDGDGDPSTTTLTINVNDVTLNPDDQTKTVNEAALDLNKDGSDLAAGTVTGSNPGSTAETVQGTLAVAGATGYTAEDITGTHGLLHLNANGTYTYTLTSPVDGTTADNGTNTVNGVESFTYTAHDADGNTVTGTITINVIDDVPTAHADVDSVTEDGPLVADGNVMTGVGGSDVNATDGVADTPGADGATVTGIKLPASVSYSAVSTAPAGTDIIGAHGTLTIHADGSYSYALNNADGAVQALGQGQSTTDVFNYQLTDGDGDTSTTTLTITINGTNDAPVVGNATANVSEEGLVGANPDSVGSPTDTTNSVTATGTVSFTDVDSGDTHTVTLTAPANGSLKSDGFNVIWTGSGTNTLHAFQDANGNGVVDAGEKAIATITINNSGNYTVTLQGPIDHADPTTEDINSFGVTVNVSDGHVTSTGTLTVNVEDDSPVNFTPDPQPSLVDDGTASATGLINDPAHNATGVNFIGADGFGSLLFTGTSALDGTALTDASNNPLTSHGQPILLSGFGTGTLTAYVDNGAHAGFQSGEDTVVFTVTLNDGTTYGSDATYTINFSDTVDNGSGVSFNNLTSTAAGNVDFRGVGADSTAQPIDLLLSGTATGGAIGTVNTDSTAIGVSNQSMDVGESLRIDFVSDLTSGGAGPTGFNFTGHVSSNGFIGLIPQVQGAQSNTVSFTVYALNTTLTQSGAPDSNPTGGFSDGSVLQTTSVFVQDFATQATATLDVSSFEGDGLFHTVAFGISVKVNSDGSVTFQGVQEGDHYGVTTASDFNALVIQDTSGSFDIGTFALSQTNQGHNIDMNFGVTAHDADGDPSTGSIAVTLVPDGVQQAATIHTAAATLAPLSTTSTDTSSLTASNDNTGHQQQRTFNVVNNTALMGAVAAAGLDSLHSLQLDHASVSGLQHSEALQPTHDMVASSTSVESSHADSGHTVQPTLTAGANTHSAPQNGGTVHDMVDSVHSLTPANGQPNAAPTELLHGSEAPAHAQGAAASAVTTMAVAMPSAEQLAAVASHGVTQAQNSIAGATAQHDQVVSKVLVDALNGGDGHGQNIDAMLSNLTGHGGAQDALQALASHGASAVSFGHMAFADAFGGAHGMLHVMQVHPDAAPVHG